MLTAHFTKCNTEYFYHGSKENSMNPDQAASMMSVGSGLIQFQIKATQVHKQM